MKLKVLFVSLAIALMLTPVAVSAVSGVAGYQAASDKAIYLDTNQLNNEIARINARKGLTDSRKQLLINIAKADIQILENMKTDIHNETNLSMAKKNYKSIKLIFSGMKTGLREAEGV